MNYDRPTRTIAVALAAFGLMLAVLMPVQAEEPKDVRRERVRQMTPAEKDQLRRRHERFEKLAPEQQERFASATRPD